MPPLSNTAGGRFFVKIDGQEILCDGIRLEDFAVLEKELLAQREPVDLLAMTADAIKGIGDAELQKSLYREALIEARRGQYVEINDILKWIQRTPEGFSLSLWLTLERAKPGKFTRDYLLDFVTKNWNSTELLRVAKDQADASGASDLGNSPLVPGAP